MGARGVIRDSVKIKMEAAPGFEPGNNGFADRRLSHLATPPGNDSFNNIRSIF